MQRILSIMETLAITTPLATVGLLQVTDRHEPQNYVLS